MAETAEILRERAGAPPQADDQATPRRGIAPPRTELGEVAARTFGQSQAAIGQRLEAERQFAGEMRPKIASAREAQEALGREVAAKPPPTAPLLPPAPSQGLRGFLAPSEGESPEASLGKLIGAMGLFATGASALSKKNARAGLAALTGAMSGWHAGDKERADRAFSDWRAKTQTALAQWETERAGYQDWLSAANLTVEQKMKGLQLEMLSHGVEMAPLELEQKGIEGALSYLTGREDAAQKLGIELLKMEQAHLRADEAEKRWLRTYEQAERHYGETQKLKKDVAAAPRPLSGETAVRVVGAGVARDAAKQITELAKDPEVVSWLGVKGYYQAQLYRQLGRKIPLKYVDMEQAVARLNNRVLNLLSGAQVTMWEQKRLMQELPKLWSHPEVFAHEAANALPIIENLEQQVRTLTQKRGVGAPVAVPPEYEEVTE